MSRKNSSHKMLLSKVVLASCWLLFTDVSPTTLFTLFCRVAVGSIVTVTYRYCGNPSFGLQVVSPTGRFAYTS